eukprot:3626305-Prymnesium_polylepis.1
MVQTRGPHRTRCGHTEGHRSEVCSDRIPWPSFTNLWPMADVVAKGGTMVSGSPVIVGSQLRTNR